MILKKKLLFIQLCIVCMLGLYNPVKLLLNFEIEDLK